MFKKKKKKYGVKKRDQYNWIIFSSHKKENGEVKENDEKFYPTLEMVMIAFLEFKVGKELEGKKLGEKKILKAINKAKEAILQEIKNVKEC